MRRNCGRIHAAVVLTSMTLALAGCVPLTELPGQGGPPSSGPGAPVTNAPDARTTRSGTGGQAIFIYEPNSAGLTSAPVIVFLHGYACINPVLYGGWIKHLVQRGNIVLYPVYQDTLLHPEQYTADALAAVQNAYAVLRAGDHVLPDDAKLALVGHSLGGVIAMNLAAVAHTQGLPRVAAVLVANAGDTTSFVLPIPSIAAGNYDQIPAEMLLLGVVGADDTGVGQDTVLSLYDAVPQIPSGSREVLELRSDYHGAPPLMADHRAPLAVDRDFDAGGTTVLLPGGITLSVDQLPGDRGAINDLDYYGYWKWLDALTDAAFYGTNREYAFGGTPQQTHTGAWDDGQPVTPAVRIRPAADGN